MRSTPPWRIRTFWPMPAAWASGAPRGAAAPRCRTWSPRFWPRPRTSQPAPGTSWNSAMAKALDKTYDAIVIGAGHHGLILGSYLAKAGLDVLLVERRLTYGGGLSTREVTQPGFYHNLHSINHFHISETPWFRDLGLGDRVTYITPR